MSRNIAGGHLPFTLFSTYHKAFPVPEVPFVRPIHAGKATSPLDLNIETDNTGDNISHLNPYFSELTVIYYIWKNYSSQQLPYWGLCHYRRYFSLHSGWFPFRKVYFLDNPDKAFKKIFTPRLLSTIGAELEKGKVILPIPYRFIKLKRWSVKKQYIKDHGAESWVATEKAVANLYPDYVESLKHVLDGLTCSWYNMLIASWNFWDGYLTWLFAILFEVKKNLQNDDDEAVLRIFGNLSERLLNVYVYHWEKRGQKVCYLPIAHIS
jgi:hypothetical protein